MLLTGKTLLDNLDNAVRAIIPVCMLGSIRNDDCSLLAGYYHGRAINYTVKKNKTLSHIRDGEKKRDKFRKKAKVTSRLGATQDIIL